MQVDKILQILPETIKVPIEKLLAKGNRSMKDFEEDFIEDFEEIRLRTNRPVIIKKTNLLFSLHKDGSLRKLGLPASDAICPSKDEMEQILLKASRFSVYAAEQQMRQGYLTIQGGHRIGICGEVIFRDGQIRGIRKVSSYNIRIAKELRGCAKLVYPWLWNQDQFLDTLIVSPVGLGKTTLLRDLIRLLSDGDGTHLPHTVGLADERGEVAACIDGVPQFDVGQNTDVLDGGSKTQTMPMLLRTMAPQILAADEAGGSRDIQIFEQAKKWGTALLTTAHGTINRHLFDTDSAKMQFDRYIEIVLNEDNQRVFRIFNEKRQQVETITGMKIAIGREGSV